MHITIDTKTYCQIQDQVFPKSIIELSFQEIAVTLAQLFSVKRNLITEIFTFHRMCQNIDRQIKDYITELWNQANKCRFGTQTRHWFLVLLIIIYVVDFYRTFEHASMTIQYEAIEKDSKFLSRHHCRTSMSHANNTKRQWQWNRYPKLPLVLSPMIYGCRSCNRNHAKNNDRFMNKNVTFVIASVNSRFTVSNRNVNNKLILQIKEDE